MAAYLQADRPMSLVTPLGADVLLLAGFEGQEAISQLFSYRLDLLAEVGAEVPFEKLLGQKVSVGLELADGTRRYFGGVCSRLGQGMRDATFTAFRMEVVPEFWFLTRVAQSRIFQQTSVPEILAAVLKGLGVDFELRGRYDPRDYCVQYRETDFHFASRLMEEAGIAYFFRHSATGHRLVVADTPGSFAEGSTPVAFDGAWGGTRFTETPRPEDRDGTLRGDRHEDRVQTWEKDQELRAGKYTLWDHCFELPHKHLEASKGFPDSVRAGKVEHKLKMDRGDRLEVYDYPGEYAQRFDGVGPAGQDRPADLQKIFEDGPRTAAIRMEEQAASSLVIRGTGDRRDFAAGMRFTLARHFDADGPYLLTSVRHSAQQSNAYRTGDAPTWRYTNAFTCIPAGLAFRPARVTPRPVIHGTQTAVVVGPKGEEIFPDKYGRVKVQFHWDRQGSNDANSSCWVRVGTPWAGKQWGMVHIPRVGQEVLVAFEEGDPDRPIVVGSVYNADMMPPYDLPKNKTQSGVKSRSSPGGTPANYNEIFFEDAKNAELLRIHAEKDQSIEVEHDESHWVGHDRTKKVDHDETTTIGNDRTETVTHDETITINNNRTETVAQNETITVSQGNRTVTISMGNESLTVKMGDQTTEISMGNQSTKISMGNQTTEISLGNQSTKISLGSSSTEAMQSIELKVGQSSLKVDQMGVTIQGMMISIQGQVQTDIKGLMTQISGDAMLKAQGAITMIN